MPFSKGRSEQGINWNGFYLPDKLCTAVDKFGQWADTITNSMRFNSRFPGVCLYVAGSNSI
jgi:hypothetical protein